MLILLQEIWKKVVFVLSQLSHLAQEINGLRKEIQSQNRKLDQVINLLKPLPASKFIFIATRQNGEVIYGVKKMNLASDEQVSLTIEPVDARGNPAPIDGVPVWSSSNSELVEVAAAADGLSAVARAMGPLGGPVTITVKIDADMTAGDKPIIGTLEITVTGGEAVMVKITAGTPTKQV